MKMLKNYILFIGFFVVTFGSMHASAEDRPCVVSGLNQNSTEIIPVRVHGGKRFVLHDASNKLTIRIPYDVFKSNISNEHIQKWQLDDLDPFYDIRDRLLPFYWSQNTMFQTNPGLVRLNFCRAYVKDIDLHNEDQEYKNMMKDKAYRNYILELYVAIKSVMLPNGNLPSDWQEQLIHQPHASKRLNPIALPFEPLQTNSSTLNPKAVSFEPLHTN